MNALGTWIKANTTRRQFAKLIGVSEQSVSRMCEKYGVSDKHIDTVSRATKIPREQLRGIEYKGKGNVRTTAPKFDGAYWNEGINKC